MQLGSWALGRAVCCHYPDGDVLVLDEPEESDWEPGQEWEERAGHSGSGWFACGIFSEGGRTNDGDDRLFVNHCHWERGAPEEAGWRSQSQLGRSQTV